MKAPSEYKNQIILGIFFSLALSYGLITGNTGSAIWFFVIIGMAIITVIIIYWKVPQSREYIQEALEFIKDLFSSDPLEKIKATRTVFSEKKALRKAVSSGLVRDLIADASNRCQMFENDKRCSYSKSNILECHHINQVRSYSELENLIVLCPNHHREIHRYNKWMPPNSPSREHMKELTDLSKKHSVNLKTNKNIYSKLIQVYEKEIKFISSN